MSRARSDLAMGYSSLKTLLAKATAARSGDELAGIAAAGAGERVAAQRQLAEVPLRRLLNEPLIPYESDEVTRLIFDTHDADRFAPVDGGNRQDPAE